ncbi:MAG: hypothetical protein NWP78_04530, partial [Ilumatobacteraceae bacterium]|nr:hypothetical protein [Ilumatobacteraceae bacterium]
TPPPPLLLLLLLLPANAELENERNGGCDEGSDIADTNRCCRIFPNAQVRGRFVCWPAISSPRRMARV